jgi:transposase
VLFRYAPGRSGAFAEQFLQDFGGQFLQCDGYDGYERLTRIERPQGPWTLVHCWSHLRRRFVKLMRGHKSPIAEAAVRQIAALYAVEATVRGMAPADRLAARRDLSAPIIEALRPWFEKQLSMISSGSTLATDIRYALTHWEGLTRFLDDGRLELDANPVENAIRPVALTRKNALFAGHEVGAENWALLASIVATCKLSDVNPVAYIAATLEAILNGHAQSKIEELMPWHFRKTSSPRIGGRGSAYRGIASGKSRRAVAAQLAPSTAVRVQARYAATGSVDPARQGRPRVRASLALIRTPFSTR